MRRGKTRTLDGKKEGNVPQLLQTQLNLPRCPYCNVDTPTLSYRTAVETVDYANTVKRLWAFYGCTRCGGVVTAAAPGFNQNVVEHYPGAVQVDESIPERARAFLSQALNSLSAPSGAVMLAASAVDSMLKAKNLTKGSLYSRIDQAAADHLITKDMAAWAHEVRLDANDERHADESGPLPDAQAAKRAVDFAIALGQFMFVLPARVKRGIEAAQKK
jgi:hypothetical protein